MEKRLRALVFGATGAAGKSIIKALTESPDFEKVTLIGRRVIELPSTSENPNYSKVDQKVVNFEDLSKSREDFQGYDVGFSALGAPSGTPNYYRINHDYVLETAKLTKEGGAKVFHLISGNGSSRTSRFEWARVKAETEEDVAALGFDHAYLYRPALILTEKRESPRRVDTLAQCVFKTLDRWRLLSIESDILAKVMVQNTFQVTELKSQIFEHGAIIRLGKELDSKKTS